MSVGKQLGANIHKGLSILHADYDIQLDTSFPDTTAFEESLEYNPQDAPIEKVAPDAQEFVINNIEHVNSIARELGEPPETVDDRRISEQLEGDVLKMSNVWNGIWGNRKIGTCQERALTLHELYNNLGFDSEYHSGTILLDNQNTYQHAWTTVEDEFISDPSKNGYGLTPMDEAQDSYIDSYIWTR